MLIKDFDPSKIFKYYHLPYIKVRKNHCNQTVTILKEHDYVFKLSRVSPILNDEKSSENKLILLKDDLKLPYSNLCKKIRRESKVIDKNDTNLDKPIGYIIQLSDDYYMKLEKIVFNKLNFLEFVEYGLFDLKVEYKYLSYIECVKQCIPNDIEIISSFETIGHISHLNLNQSTFPYRYLIGKILLDKNPGIKTVVTKTGNIENEFRTYPLEVIAGENNLKAKLKEQGITYNVNIDQVYWNSRLSNERQRITNIIPKDSTVFDLTCGVGAFTLPLIKLNNCMVYSNDLNPQAIRLLNENIVSNKLNLDKIVTSQRDCIEFINDIMNQRLHIKKKFNSNNLSTHQENTFHWICNLPELSLDMLKAFVPYKQALLENKTNNDEQVYTKNFFYFYCFSKGNDPFNDIKKRIDHSLKVQEQLSEPQFFTPFNLNVYDVRDVSPNKKMYCAQFNMAIPILI